MEESLKNIELDTLSLYGGRYIQNKIRAYGNNVCTNFRGLNVSGDDAECKFLTVISVDSLLVYENKHLQVYLYNYAYKIIDKELVYHLGNLFETDKNYYFDFDKWVLLMLYYKRID